MADIRCPNCGKNNPDFLDACQFCQTPLTHESMVHTGESPTKKNTGELEPILPEWLRDMRQQGRDSMEEGELPSPATQPRGQKNDAPDLLAGLASQNDDDDDEIPDWLASISPVTKPKPATPSSSEPSIDFFAQFNKSEPASQKPPQESEPAKEETPSWMDKPSQQELPAEKDELSDWLASASGDSGKSFDFQPTSSEPASQPAPEEKEDLGWLHDLEASAKQSDTSSQSKQDTAWNFEASSVPLSSDAQEDLSWLNSLGGTSELAESVASQPSQSQASQQDDLSWLDNLGGTSEPAQTAASQPSQQEDLSWLNNLGGSSEPAQTAASQPSQQEDLSWLNNLGGTSEPVQPVASQPSQQEDLSWLNNLGGSSEPAQTAASQPSQQEDLSWLNNLGGTPESSQSAASQPSSSDDLSWLKDFGETTESTQASTPQEDLGWMNNLGGVAESVQPASEPSTSQDDLGWLKNFSIPAQDQSTTEGSQDLSWLDSLGGTSEPSQPASAESAPSQDGLDWLANLGEPSSSAPAYAKPFGTTDELSPPKGFDEEVPSHVSPFVPRRTAPLSDTNYNDDMPDWLRSATEETPVLPLGSDALEQFRETPRKSLSETLPPTPETEAVNADVSSASAESQPLSNQELDSLLSMDMPDWLSKPQPEVSDVSSESAKAQPAFDESLSPVELPSWVQAMRPVEAVISESGAPSIETQPTEREGPLAGLRGIIPFAPIGSSRRPKAISLKLQATEDQQAGAALFDRILAGEATPRVVTSLSVVTSQNILRWAIAGILLALLSVVVFMRSQFMPVSAITPPDVSAASNAIAALPNDAPVLVVVDYEPSLAGEMEAVSAPVLNQLLLTRQVQLVFLSTSPSGTGLIERLLATVQITAPNLGYLPGGSAGIAGFVTHPNRVFPSAAAQFSGYSAVILLTDNAESGRSWVEQLDLAKRGDATLATQPLILVTSAQAGPLLQPYVSSKQAVGMVNGLADAVRFEYANNIPVGNRIASTYWDAFGIGILLAILMIIVGSAWSLVIGIRARRANGEQG